MNPYEADNDAPREEDLNSFSGRPIIMIGDIAKDLSNLCVQRIEPNHLSQRGPRHASSGVPSELNPGTISKAALELRYPASDDFSRNSMSDVSVDEIFNDVPLIVEGGGKTRRRASDTANYPKTRRGSSIDIDRVDDWIVEPVDLAAKNRRSPRGGGGSMTPIASPQPLQFTESTLEETDSYSASIYDTPCGGRKPILSRFPSQEFLYGNEKSPPPPPPPPPPAVFDGYDTLEYSHVQTHLPPPPPPDCSSSSHLQRSSISQPSTLSTNSDWLNTATTGSFSPSHSRHRRTSYHSSTDVDYSHHSFDLEEPRLSLAQSPRRPLLAVPVQEQFAPPLPPPTPPPPPPPSHDPVEIEVAPGEFLPLRGSRETLLAIESGQSQRVSCMACGVLLTCIKDCLMVICPDCRCISQTPHENDPSTVWVQLEESAASYPQCSSNVHTSSPRTRHDSSDWWEREEEDHETSFLGGFAARHRQEATRRRASPMAVSTQPKYGVGLGLKVEG